ncbi:neuferricin-like [Diadema setosum]|uniref:neuferricin-like n=1 Tax=Diadema setosum TaxID=31175 RepID=UPI003B3ACD71
MASLGIITGILVAIIACIIIVLEPGRARNALYDNGVQGIVSKIIQLFIKEDNSSADLGQEEETSTDTITRIFTEKELGHYDGSSGSPGLYLAIMGKVFDVQKGARHYSPGGGYHFFAARDGSKAFISGDFTEEGLTPDVSGLSPQQMVDLENWVKFFQKEYNYVGKLSGHFYDSHGNPTSSLLEAQRMIQEGERLKEDEAAHQRHFPFCNSEWTQAAGLRVWCSKKSGGISREWTGVPRKLFNPGTNKWRCACIKEDELDNPHLRLYDDCEPMAISCRAGP